MKDFNDLLNSHIEFMKILKEKAHIKHGFDVFDDYESFNISFQDNKLIINLVSTSGCDIDTFNTEFYLSEFNISKSTIEYNKKLESLYLELENINDKIQKVNDELYIFTRDLDMFKKLNKTFGIDRIGIDVIKVDSMHDDIKKRLFDYESEKIKLTKQIKML